MPVTAVIGGEGPFDGLECYTGLDVWVSVDVKRVIVINKIIRPDPVINGCGRERQSYANPKLVKAVEFTAVFVHIAAHYVRSFGHKSKYSAFERSFKKKDLKEL
jgi:hypothetical protein